MVNNSHQNIPNYPDRAVVPADYQAIDNGLDMIITAMKTSNAQLLMIGTTMVSLLQAQGHTIHDNSRRYIADTLLVMCEVRPEHRDMYMATANAVLMQ